MKQFWSSLGWIVPELELVRAIILECIEQTRLPHHSFEAAAWELFNPPGKMIRPALLILATHACADGGTGGLKSSASGWKAEDFRREFLRQYPRITDLSAAEMKKPPVESALPLRLYILAAAVELLHTAILLHDDVLDQADLRRGQPTVRQRLGNRVSILLGDHLLSMAFQMVGEAASINSAKLISRVTSAICRGELLQTALSYNAAEGKSPRRYKQKIAGKTALLFALAADIGAREAGQEAGPGTPPTEGAPLTTAGSKVLPEICQYIRRYGYALGMAFQIIDDIHDLDTTTDSGKPRGQDLKAGIITLPIIYLLKNEGISSDQIQSMWQNNDTINLPDDKLNKACSEAASEADRYTKRATVMLQKATKEKPDGDFKPLKTLADMLLTRAY